MFGSLVGHPETVIEWHCAPLRSSCIPPKIVAGKILHITETSLKVPTDGRLPSWLITKREGVESETTKHKSILWLGKGFEPGTSGLQIQRLA